MPRGDSDARRVERFVGEYLVDLNGAAAAVRSGYPVNGARQRAYELLQRADVKAAVDAEIAWQRDHIRGERQKALDEAWKIALASISYFLRPGGAIVKDLQDVPAVHRAAIKKIRKGKTGTTIEFHDKIKALEFIARVEGWIDAVTTGDVRPRAILQIPGMKVE